MPWTCFPDDTYGEENTNSWTIMTIQGFLSEPHPLRAFACLRTETLTSKYLASWPSLNCLGEGCSGETEIKKTI